MKAAMQAAAAAAVFAAAAASAGQAQEMTVSRAGSRPTTAGPAQNFTGAVRVEPLFSVNEPSRVSGAYVTFAPGARSAWHSHPLGQTLVVTAGVGRIQRWGGAVQEIRAGDVIWTPPGVKHWHGASPDAAMTHMAVQENASGSVVEWLEQVSDADYRAEVRK